MQKKILSLIFFILLSLIIFFLFYQSRFTKNVKKRDYILIKLFNKGSYPYKKPFFKGIKAINAILILSNKTQEIKSIYKKVNRKWVKILKDEKLYKDYTLKVKY